MVAICALVKEQRAFLHQAGFVNIETSASYDCYGPEIAEVFIEMLQGGSISRQLMQLGQATRSDLAKMAQAWQAWANNPDRLFADAFCESVGWKPQSG